MQANSARRFHLDRLACEFPVQPGSPVWFFAGDEKIPQNPPPPRLVEVGVDCKPLSAFESHSVGSHPRDRMLCQIGSQRKPVLPWSIKEISTRLPHHALDCAEVSADRVHHIVPKYKERSHLARYTHQSAIEVSIRVVPVRISDFRRILAPATRKGVLRIEGIRRILSRGDSKL